jgi:hypothetical protein
MCKLVGLKSNIATTTTTTTTTTATTTTTSTSTTTFSQIIFHISINDLCDVTGITMLSFV